MSLFLILRSISRLKPGRMLDIGARDGTMAKHFADFGYTVDAIEPNPPADIDVADGITYRQTTLEDFEARGRYDLVVASLVSHLVDDEPPAFLARLKALAKPDGLVYVTLVGDQDDWAANPCARAMSFETACGMASGLGLTALYRSVEWLEGRVYSGEAKSWHLYRFVLSAEG